MTIKVYVSDDFCGLGVKIAIVSETDSRKDILRFHDGGTLSWEAIADPNIVIEPTLTVDSYTAIALTQALVSHFNGAEDTRQLRKDYEHEKARVDKFIGYLIHEPTGE